MNTRTALTALTLAGTLTLTACGSSGSTYADEPPASVAASDTASSPSAAEQVDGDTAASGSPEFVIYGFGQTAPYPNSTVPYELTLSTPQPFTPSESASGAPGAGGALRFDITVTNKGQAPMDLFSLYPTATSGGSTAEPIFDTEQGIESTPSTALLPGQSVTYAAAFGVADAADLTAQVAGATYEDAPALFSLTQATNP